MKEQTLGEMEKLDEKKLMDSLNNMNLSFRSGMQKDFLSAVTYLCNSGNSEKLPYGDDYQTYLTGSTLVSSYSTHLVAQNLIAEESLKLILVGDKGVGKSFLISKLTENSPPSFPAISNYTPTNSLEIKKIVCKLLNKIVKLEFWDTSVNIIQNNLMKTYYKLCNGFILVCDVSNLESIKFIEKQIDVILTHANVENIFLFANIKETVNIEEFHLNLNFLNYLTEKFMIKPVYANLMEYSFNKDMALQKFINNSLIKKLDSKHNNCNINKKSESMDPCIKKTSSNSKYTKDNCLIF
jgi:small GTP-binding protein